MEDVFKDIKPLSHVEFEHYKQVEDAVSLASKEVLVEHYCDMHGIEPGYDQNMECCPWSPKYQMFDGHQECSASNECAEFEMAFLSNVCGGDTDHFTEMFPDMNTEQMLPGEE